jgi:Tfp pilus assembly protein PilF
MADMTATAPHGVVLQADAHRQSGRFADALALVQPLLDSCDAGADRVLALDIAAFCSLGLGRTLDAEKYWRVSIEIAPDVTGAYQNLGVMLKGLGRVAEAETLFREVLAKSPDTAEARFHLASILFREHRFGDAEAEYRHVLRIMPAAAEAHNNLGNLLEVLDRFSEAESHIRIALCLNPDLAEAHYNLASLMRQVRRLDESESAYRRALVLRPGYRDASLGLSTLLMSMGRFDEGWERYESRYDYPLFVHGQSKTMLGCQQWQGEPLAGKSLLVWQEDGLGDMVQFARYLPMLKAAGARHVALGCVNALHRLLANGSGVDAVLDHATAQAQSASFDYWTSLVSAPLHFRTTVESIPEPLRLRPDQALIDQWRPPIAALRGAVRIGLVWKGNPKHHNDANRSLPSVATLAPLWSVPGARFVSLQKGQGEEEAAHAPENQPLLHLGSAVTDLADSAAVIAELDLVICVDTSIAHLAASLGKPCWVLLPARDVDWRWMNDRDDSPWYPQNVRLFRQRSGDRGWARVIERIVPSLAAFVGAASVPD